MISLRFLIVAILTLHKNPVSAWNWTNNDACGKLSNDILEGPGLNSMLGIPWIVRIEAKGSPSHPAVIISPNLLLSDSFFVNTGKIQFSTFNEYKVFAESSPSVQLAEISHISIHPKYSLEPALWQLRYSDIALIHLKEPLNLSGTLPPICLPTIENLAQMEQPGNITLTGINKDISTSTFLHLDVQSRSKCSDLWSSKNGRMSYKNQFCGLVNTNNNHTSCIRKDVAAIRMINEAYYFAGIVSNFFSSDGRGTCRPGALYFFYSFNDDTLKWISRTAECGPEKFPCHSSSECINLEDVCNDVKNCLDGSDEKEEFCKAVDFCTEDQFSCGAFDKCISKLKVLDEIVDCKNELDEDEKFIELNAGRKGLLFRWQDYFNNKMNRGGISSGKMAIVFGTAVLIFLGILFLIVRSINSLKNKVRDLTPSEVDAFRKGAPDVKQLPESYLPLTIDHENIDTDQLEYVRESYVKILLTVEGLPWDEHFEINFNRLEFLHELKRGNYGIVRKARLKKERGKVQDVAVKTHLPRQEDTFKTLKSELKILSYVGTHPNVVEFIGASTEYLQRREVYLVVEYCPNGDLKTHLEVVIRKAFKSGESTLPIEIFLRWCFEIASGMEHITSKQIVHGDLATRNILLTSNFTCKITDFGLSRHLKGPWIYFKKTEEAFPWQWLPLEFLRDRAVLQSLDVWSFGVLIWEIFTLGLTPFVWRNFDQNFIQDLIRGMRLPKPDPASDQIYEIMRRCWQNLPTERPSFTELKTVFQNIRNEMENPTQRNTETQF